MLARAAALPLFAALTFALTSCQSDQADSGGTEGSASDAAVAIDPSVASDAAVATDAEVPLDARAATDAEIARDADITVDAALDRDAEIARDAEVTDDAEVVSDAEVDMDGDVADGGVALPDGGGAECTDGALDVSSCGANGRGEQTRVCAGGRWAEPGPCVDADGCRDGTREARACGRNHRGQQERLCTAGSWGAWSACADADVCDDGEVRPAACDGAEPRGASECVHGQWSEPASCPVRACQPGEHEARSCGFNARGVQLRSCSGGEWGEFGTCDDRDVCRDGSASTRSCGLNGAGLERRECSAGQWGAYTGCVDPDVCVDESSEGQPCGLNGRGVQRRACSGGGWSSWSVCADADQCLDGTTSSQACGLNGRGEERRLCTAGRWSEYGACDDADRCRDGDGEAVACGFNGRGSQRRGCEQGAWTSWSECADLDACVDGETSSRPCGLNGRGEQLRSCTLGQWGDYEDCSDVDVCVDGATESRSRYEAEVVLLPGTCQRQDQTRQCVQGNWWSWSGWYTFEGCTVRAANDCDGLSHGEHQVRYRYRIAIVDDYQSCEREVQSRICNDGTLTPWSGSFGAPTCAISLGGACAMGDLENRPCAEGVCAYSSAGPRCLLDTGAACSSDEQCAGTCVAGVCRPLSGAGHPCDDVSDCTNHANDRSCVDGLCRAPDGYACWRNEECLNSCLNGRCAPRDAQCDPDDSSDCPVGTTCEGTFCVRPDGSSCSWNRQCHEACRNYVCSPLAGFDGSCDEHDDCEGELVCNGPWNGGSRPRCRVDFGDACTQQNQCPDNSCECADAQCTVARCAYRDACRQCERRINPHVLYGHPQTNCAPIAAGFDDLVQPCPSGACNGSGRCAN
jgi:hypothetical protein